MNTTLNICTTDKCTISKNHFRVINIKSVLENLVCKYYIRKS